MAKSRVEKNKALYEELENEEFDLVDVTEEKKPAKETKVEEVVIKEKKQEIVPVSKPKKNEVAVVKEKVKAKAKVEVVEEDDFVATQPISYTDKLSIEEILRVKLEKQQQLKDSKKIYKRTPITKTYTPEMMQKNINQRDGIDIRKEANIKVKQGSNSIAVILMLLLLVVIATGVIAIYLIW